MGQSLSPVTVHHHPGTPPGEPIQHRNTNETWLDPRAGLPGADSGRRRILIAHRGIDTNAAVTITDNQARTGAVVTVAALDDPIEGRRLRNLRVRIPPGTRDGQTVRIPGHGTPGINGGPAGDLHLTIYHATP